MNKTKIVCTLGPSSSSYEQIVRLMKAGMNIARLNFSHGTHSEHKEVIDRLKKARKELSQPLAIMLDNKGPEVRIGEMSAPLQVKTGDSYFLTESANDNPKHIPINPHKVLLKLDVGVKILFNDGYVTSHVTRVEDNGVWVEIDNEGVLSTHKGVNVPGVSLDLPSLTDKDIQDIKFGCEEEVNILSASFIRLI